MASDALWINPIGGIGDMLMLSGVLKQVVDKDAARRFNLIRRSGYDTVLGGHPAIAHIGFVPKGERVVRVDYWSMEKLGPGLQRPMQVLARGFGLPTPIEERLWVPGELEADPLLDKVLPKGTLVAIAPSSDSPRKVLKLALWERIVALLRADGLNVIQLGRERDPYVRGAHSLLGLTTPRQAMAMLKRCQLFIGPDSFLAHAAHLTGTKAVVMWGATHHLVYGYPEQTHLQLPKACGLEPLDDCIGPVRNVGGKLYGTTCPHGDLHCVDQLDPATVHAAARAALGL
jgi:ADP-heptose:LPS heptosyltransferase